jgi:hypothetical protein
LYPPAWRARYGEEFLATVGDGSLDVQQTIDIVSAAIDAWFSADVRRATLVSRVAPNKGGPVMLKSLMVCERAQARYTKRDALIGAGVMLGLSLALTTAGALARRAGWSETGEVVVALSLPVSSTLSMPFWLMKGQPWKAQVAIVGVTLALLVAIGYISTLI